MPATLERLVYESTATGTTGSLLNLATVLGASQANNARRGLTGALAAHADRYVQVVEGPREALDALLTRLAGDPRHRDIRILDRRPIAARVFADWSMASPRFNPATRSALDRLMAEPAPSADRIVTLLREALAAEPSQAA
ncbi:hypothetical protein BH09PSE1_BH09PSE1_30190 [soil metagenome]